MKQQKKKRFLYCTAACLLLAAALYTCKQITERNVFTNSRNIRHKFGAIYMTMNNPFYEIIDDEIRSVLEANGDVLITRDSALDEEKQIEQVQEMIDRKVSGIFINPVNWKEIDPVLKKAKDAGIPIIVVDSAIFDTQLASCMVMSDNYNAGVQCAQHLMKKQDSANILILTHKIAKSGIDRINGFKDTLKPFENYHILAEEDCLGQLELAMPAVTKLLVKYPQTDVIMCLNDLAAMGAMASLKDAGLTGKIAVYGIDGSPDGKSMIEEGIMEATAAQFPRKIGREAAETIYHILEGQSVAPEILIKTELITKDNIEKYGSDSWQ